jgi:thioredoxin reductase (NADPH)
MEKQAKNFGAYFVYDEVTGLNDAGRKKEVKTASGAVYTAFALIIATGAKYRELGVPGEAKYKGRGVSNCATCDAAFYRNMDVAVIGGGDTALEESDFLTKFAKKVYLIHRRDRFRAAKIIQDRTLINPKIEFIYDTVAEEISGTKTVEKLRLKNLKTGVLRDIPVAGVFVFIGLIPGTDFMKGFVDMDADGHIKADCEMRTSREGVFACGDCIAKDLRQVVTAAGDGATAAYKAQHWVDKLKGTEYV